VKITRRQLRQIIREGVALALHEQATNQTYVAYAVVDEPSGRAGTGTAYDEEDEPIGTFEYEADIYDASPVPGVDVEITKLDYTSGPHAGEEVDVDPNVLEDLVQGIADELPYGFEPSRSF